MKKINIIKFPNGELAQLLEDGTTELLPLITPSFNTDVVPFYFFVLTLCINT